MNFSAALTAALLGSGVAHDVRVHDKVVWEWQEGRLVERADLGRSHLYTGRITHALQYSAAVANAKLDAIETTIGTDAKLMIRTGAAPANLATADSGTVLATLTLPTDWMAAASGGAKAKSGTWQDTSADNSGTAAHFRVYQSDGTTKHIQGSYGVAATDMIGDSTSFTAGQSFTINSFTLTTSTSNYP